MSSAPSLKQRAKAYPLKKALSQNFLVDEAAINGIAQAVVEGLLPSARIIEVGPGSGFLTEALLATGHPVTAFEVDEDMIGILEKTLVAGGLPLTVHRKNILYVDLLEHSTPGDALVGNLPYHLTGPILMHVCGPIEDAAFPLRQQFKQLVFMVQQEVADRLTAQPGTKAYGQLTLHAQYWFEITPVLAVPRQGFYPAPKVDSAVVKLTPRSTGAVPVKDLALFSRLIKAAFQHRRKTFLNSVKTVGGFNMDTLTQVLSDLGLSPTIRGEAMSMVHYAACADTLATAH